MLPVNEKKLLKNNVMSWKNRTYLDIKAVLKLYGELYVTACFCVCRKRKRPWRQRSTTWRRCRTRQTLSRWPHWIRRWPRRGPSLCSWRSTPSRRKWTSSPWTWRSSSTRLRRRVRLRDGVFILIQLDYLCEDGGGRCFCLYVHPTHVNMTSHEHFEVFISSKLAQMSAWRQWQGQRSRSLFNKFVMINYGSVYIQEWDISNWELTYLFCDVLAPFGATTLPKFINQ